jgi:hypothetical protein
MTPAPPRSQHLYACLLLSLLLAGCSQTQPGKVTEPLVRHSSVHGGQQPISGATLQLYAVGTTGDGSAATPLLTQTVTSDASGNFNLTGAYTCPSASTLVYVVATGGNPGLSPGTNNTDIALMAALGPCGNLTGSTFITINELTTVGAIWPLAPFMASYTNIGSGSSDGSALASAFTLASQYVNTTTGSAPGQNVPSGTTVPVTQLNTLADILSSCVNSAGGVSGDGSTCGTLFAAATPTGGTAPTDISVAGLNIANNPTANISNLYALLTPTAAFQPTLASPPADWTVQLTPSSTGAALTIAPVAQSFPDTVVGVPSSPVSITVTNVGASSAALYGFSIVGVNAGDFIQSTSCPGNLAPSATCTVQITFTPLAIGARSAYLSIISNAPNSPQMIALSGSGLPGSAGPVSITPSSLNFLQPGDIRTLTLTNNGTSSLSIGAITLSSSNWTQVNNCGSVLDGQSVCTIAITAGSQIGQFSGTLAVVDNDTNDAQTVQLTSDLRSLAGTDYLSNGIIGQQNNSFSTSHIGGVYDGTLGNYTFYIYGGSFAGPEATDFFAEPNPCMVKDSVECQIYMGSQPSAPGPRSAYFIDSLNNVFLELGFGIGPTASFVFSPIALNFGNLVVGATTTLNLQVDNSSSVVLNMNTPTLSGGQQNTGDFQIVSSTCSQSVPAVSPYNDFTQGCTLQVSFTPKALGPRAAILTISDSTGNSQQALITGQGTYSAPLISPSQLQFGGVQTGATSAPQTVTVTLPNQDAAVANIASSSSPYQLSQNSTCNRGASICQFTVVFSPTTTGTLNDKLVVTDTVTGYSSQINLSGSGGLPVVSLSQTSLTYSARTVGMTSTPQTVTLTNTGNVPLAISAVGLAGANPSDFSITASTCGTSVAVGANCNLSVSFTPGATGTRTAALQILSNAPSSPDQVQLSGTGN